MTVCVCLFASLCVSVCLYVSLCVSMCIYVYLCVCMCMHVSICVCTCICVYIYICKPCTANAKSAALMLLFFHPQHPESLCEGAATKEDGQHVEIQHSA